MYSQVFKANPYHKPAGAGGGQFTYGPGGPAAKHTSMKAMLAQVSSPDGGFTYQPSLKTSPKVGFALSPFPDKSFAKPAKDLTAKDLAAYYKSNKDMFSNPEYHMGAWHDPASGMVFLDVSIVTHDAKEAAKLCKKHDQIAYFDLAAGQSVTVDAKATSGGVAKKESADMPSANKEQAQKPELHLLPGQDAGDLNNILDLFRSLTGREPTPEDIAEAKAELEK